MNLDRNENKDGKGKYALILLRQLQPANPHDIHALAQQVARKPDCIDLGNRGSDSEFFVLRLKDKYAADALEAYGQAILDDPKAPPELIPYANQVLAMSVRARDDNNHYV